MSSGIGVNYKSARLFSRDFSDSANKKVNYLYVYPDRTVIQNVVTPTSDGDAANKKYVDDCIAASATALSVPGLVTFGEPSEDSYVPYQLRSGEFVGTLNGTIANFDEEFGYNIILSGTYYVSYSGHDDPSYNEIYVSFPIPYKRDLEVVDLKLGGRSHLLSDLTAKEVSNGYYGYHGNSISSEMIGVKNGWYVNKITIENDDEGVGAVVNRLTHLFLMYSIYWD